MVRFCGEARQFAERAWLASRDVSVFEHPSPPTPLPRKRGEGSQRRSQCLCSPSGDWQRR